MPKPEFDPNQPFERTDTQKPEFDPSKPFSKDDPEIGQKKLSNLRDFKAKIDAQLSPEGVNQLAASALLPHVAPAAAQGAGFIKRLLISGGQGAASAYASDPNTPPEDRPAKTAGGFMLGVGLGAVGEAASKLVNKAASYGSEKLSDFAEEKAFKAAGAMKKDFNKALDQDKMNDLGRYLLDSNTVTPLATTSKIAGRLSEAKQAAGEEIGHILSTVDTQGAPAISARDIALQLSDDPEIDNLKKIPGKEKIANQIETYLNTLYKNGDEMNLHTAQKLRQGIDSSIDFNKRVPDMAGAQPYLTKIRNAISDKMSEAVDAFDQANGNLVTNRLRQANKAYSQLSALDEIASNRMAAEAANRAIGLTDTISGGAGATIGSHIGKVSGFGSKAGAVAGGAIGALGNKAGRTFGPSLMATGADVASKGLGAAASVYDAIKANPARLPQVVIGDGGESAIPVSGDTPTILLFGSKPLDRKPTETAIDRRLKQQQNH